MARKKTNVTPTETWDKDSKVDEYDGRENKQAGDKGSEPGGRWAKAYYDKPAVIISKYNIREP